MQQKIYKNIVVIVRIFEVKTEEVVKEQTFSLDGKQNREYFNSWLQRNAMWAVMNGKGVEILNKEDDSAGIS